MKNPSPNAQTDAVNTDSFSDYSRTCTTHSAQDVERYKLPSTISEISVASCQDKGLRFVAVNGIVCTYVWC